MESLAERDASAIRLGPEIGRGRFAAVHKADANGAVCAAKIVHDGEGFAHALAEIAILQRCSHDAIVWLLDAFRDSSTGRLYVLLEHLAGGDLFERLERSGGRYEEDVSARLALQAGGALGYLHARGIVHRDLKPDNLVYASAAADAPVKLVDFGFAATNLDGLEGLCASPDYAAPEVLSWRSSAHGVPYGAAVDMWALGVVLYICLSGFHPFYSDGTGDDPEADPEAAMLERARTATFSFPQTFDGEQTAWAREGGCSGGARSLIRRLLFAQPTLRLDAEGVTSDAWVRTFAEPFSVLAE